MQPMRQPTVLITGGLGFIGTNIVRYLLKTTNFNILIFDKSTYAGSRENLPEDQSLKRRVTLVAGDILKRRQVEAAVRRCRYILHLAADTHTFRSLDRALPTVQTNVIGTTILLETAVKFGTERFIQFSSSEVYGDQLPGIPMDEKHPLNPVTPYAASKLAADRLANSFYLTKKLPVTVLRPFNAYGAYQHPEKMVPLFITKFLKGGTVTLNHGGKPQRDWVYVEDHARAVEMVLKAPVTKVAGGVFNVGTGKATSIREVAETICRIMGLKPRDRISIAESSRPETMGNVGISRHFTAVVGWKPSVTLEEGLERTVRWYKKNRDWWEKRMQV